MVNAAVKTVVASNFWCEIYLSLIALSGGSDYSPNSNADIVVGLSTWAGCGSKVDGLLSALGCEGKRSFIPAGNNNTDVDAYFAIKTGSTAGAIDVLVDQVSLTKVND